MYVFTVPCDVYFTAASLNAYLTMIQQAQQMQQQQQEQLRQSSPQTSAASDQPQANQWWNPSSKRNTVT